MKLWGRANSSNVMKVLWACAELGLDYDRIDAGGAFGRTREPAYLAMNPTGRIPTLEAGDGFTLWESNAIIRYLCNRHAPDHTLYPAAPELRADVERWMDWQLASVTDPMTVIFFTYVRTPAADRDWAATARALTAATALWAILDGRLADRPYVCGAHLTLADIALGPYLHRWFMLPIERPAMPNLEAWRARLSAQHAGYRTYLETPLT